MSTLIRSSVASSFSLQALVTGNQGDDGFLDDADLLSLHSSIARQMRMATYGVAAMPDPRPTTQTRAHSIR